MLPVALSCCDVAQDHPALHVAFLRVMHMMRSPFSLMAPGALAHVLARATRRALGPPPPPSVHASLLEPVPPLVAVPR